MIDPVYVIGGTLRPCRAKRRRSAYADDRQTAFCRPATEARAVSEHTCQGTVRGAKDCPACRTEAARRGAGKLPGYAPLRRAVFRPYADGVTDNLTASRENDGTGRGAFVADVEVSVD